MKKILVQLFFLVAPFFGLWLLLSQIEFIQPDSMLKFGKQSEKKLAELLLNDFEENDKVVRSPSALAFIDSIGRRLCESNKIEFDSIHIHLIIRDEVNAFALPDRNMIIYTGLIMQSKNAGEVAGVMAHEIGHMEKNHVMKKLGKEVGLTMLMTLIDGGKHLEITQELARTLSSSAFDRKQESEADEFAVGAMAAASIDPEYMANFLFRFSRKNNTPEELVWLTTHPRSETRAAEILKMKKEMSFTERPILGTPWAEVKAAIVKASEK